MTEQDQNLEVTAEIDGPEDDAVDLPVDAPDEAAGEPAEAGTSPAPSGKDNLDLIMQIPLSVEVVLGSATLPVSRLMNLGRGSVVALDRKVGEPVDLVVSGRVIARGEMVLLEDGSSRFGLSLTEIVQNSGLADGLRNAGQ